MAAGLLEMFLVHVRPGHPVWAKAPAPRPLLVAQPAQVEQPAASAVPITLPQQAAPVTPVVPVPLHNKPDQAAGHPAFDPAADQ
jgi:hypothetical protein